jgi:hypothetical protein
MSLPRPSQLLSNSAWIEVEKLCRRICFLRAVGRQRDAERVQRMELPEAFAPVRRQAADPAAVADRLRALLEAEQKRADRAVVFAGGLSPRLLEHPEADKISRQIRAMRKMRPLDARG